MRCGVGGREGWFGATHAQLIPSKIIIFCDAIPSSPHYRSCCWLLAITVQFFFCLNGGIQRHNSTNGICSAVNAEIACRAIPGMNRHALLRHDTVVRPSRVRSSHIAARPFILHADRRCAAWLNVPRSNVPAHRLGPLLSRAVKPPLSICCSDSHLAHPRVRPGVQK